MSELYIAALESALGEKIQDEKIQDALNDVTATSIPTDHPEQHPKRAHLRVLKIRRDRDVREFLNLLRKKDSNKAVLMDASDNLKNRQDQCNFNKAFMQRLIDTEPEFRAIFSYYDNLRRWVNAGTYKPADQVTDEVSNNETH